MNMNMYNRLVEWTLLVGLPSQNKNENKNKEINIQGKEKVVKMDEPLGFTNFHDFSTHTHRADPLT